MRIESECTIVLERCARLSGKKHSRHTDTQRCFVQGLASQRAYYRFITGVRMVLDNNNYAKVMQEGRSVTDVRRRREILKFVEDFRCYYNEKNINALEKVFSEDALIITGSVVMKKNMGDLSGGNMKIRYNKKTKQEYITFLSRTFDSNA